MILDDAKESSATLKTSGPEQELTQKIEIGLEQLLENVEKAKLRAGMGANGRRLAVLFTQLEQANAYFQTYINDK